MPTQLYNTAYVVSYMDSGVFLETDNVNDAERSFVLNCIYRQDLLNIFGLEEFNEFVINAKIKNLSKLLKYHSGLLECMLVASKTAGDAEDVLTGLIILFSFDYLHLLNPCICEYIETGRINQTAIDNLKLELGKIGTA